MVANKPVRLNIGEPCVKCQRRKSKRVNGLCRPCGVLADAEGTEIEGLKLSLFQQKALLRRERVKQYNRLVRKGVMAKEIAAMWGMTPKNLAAYMQAARNVHGLNPINFKELKMIKGQPPKEIVVGRKNSNGHGGGRWGVAGCPCDLCMATVRRTRSEIDKRRYQRKKQQQQEQQQEPS